MNATGPLATDRTQYSRSARNLRLSMPGPISGTASLVPSKATLYSAVGKVQTREVAFETHRRVTIGLGSPNTGVSSSIAGKGEHDLSSFAHGKRAPKRG
jgi:hypothetical protein